MPGVLSQVVEVWEEEVLLFQIVNLVQMMVWHW